MIDLQKDWKKLIDTGMKFKKALQSRNLTRGKAKCPFCETGYLHGVIAGRKSHLHFQCDGCNVFFME
jgi:transposase-like protein